MGLFGKNRLERELDSFSRLCAERNIEYQMVKHGWKMWKPDATSEEQTAAITAYMDGKHVEWYPPGYQEPYVEPVDDSGKLSVDPDPGEEPPRKRFFGLF